MTTTRALTIRVWDIGVRLFHWMLVALVAASAVTGFILGLETLAWHLLAGEAIIVLLGWRVVWGWLGGPYARFASFAYAPGVVLAHLGELARGRAHRHLGHNPLGAMMVFGLIAVLAAIVLTGAVALGGMLKQGPLRGFLSYGTGTGALEVHNILAILLLVMIGLHLMGVGFESWRGRENLVRAMVSGDKDAVPAGEAVRPVRARTELAMGVSLGLLAVGVAGVACVPAGAGSAAGGPGSGFRRAMRGLPPGFSRESGACRHVESHSGGFAASFRRGCHALGRSGRADQGVAGRQFGRALGHAAGACAARAGGGWVGSDHGYAGLAQGASRHPGGHLHRQAGVSAQQLRSLPCGRGNRPVQPAEHRHPGGAVTRGAGRGMIPCYDARRWSP
jgi:cytochrome b